MAERISMPPTLSGNNQEQIRQLWQYLYKMAETMNRNLDSIGTNELTDSEKQIMRPIMGDDKPNSLKRMIIKTAEYAQK